MSNTKIYLNNLDKSVTETLLKAHFSDCGEITAISLPLDKKSGQTKGYAFISFAQQDSAKNALQQDGKTFLDKQLTVQIAIEKQAKK